MVDNSTFQVGFDTRVVTNTIRHPCVNAGLLFVLVEQICSVQLCEC